MARTPVMALWMLGIAGCGGDEDAPGAGAAGNGGAAGAAGAAGSSAGGAAGSLESTCRSVAHEPYESDLPVDDPCKLPGAEAEGPPQPTPAAAAPLDPLARGPYPIGVTTLQLDSAGRKILVEIWYPASDAVVGRPTDVYTYPEDAPPGAVDGVEAACLGLEPLDSGAYRDAPPSSDGPFPLVVFSHGTTSTRVQSASVTSHLATHGFVVASPDHTGDTLLEFFEKKGEQNPLTDPVAALTIASNRVDDVSAILDFLQQASGTDGCFAGLADAEHAGVFGHSFGGFTALAASGGSPIGAGPDSRIRAVLPVAPGGTSITTASDDPILSMGGDADVTTPFDSETHEAWRRSSAPKHLVKLKGAGHLTTSDMCLLKLEEQIAIFGFEGCGVCPIVEAGCPGGTEEMLETRPQMQYFTAAFFLAYLGEGDRAEQARELLDPAGPGPARFASVWSGVEVQ